MKKEIVNILNEVVAKSKFADTEKLFFSCLSHVMIIDSIIQLKKRKSFYLKDDYAFNHFINEDILCFYNGYAIKMNESFFKKFSVEIFKVAHMIHKSIQKQYFSDIFNEVFEEYYNQNSNYTFAKYTNNKALSDKNNDYSSFTYNKDGFYNIESIKGTGFILSAKLDKINDESGIVGIQKTNIIYTESDPFFANIFIAQLLTQMASHDLDFNLVEIYITNTKYCDFKKLFKEKGHAVIIRQNKTLAEKVLNTYQEVYGEKIYN